MSAVPGARVWCPRGPGLWGWHSDGERRRAVERRPRTAPTTSSWPGCWLGGLWEPQAASFPLSHTRELDAQVGWAPTQHDAPPRPRPAHHSVTELSLRARWWPFCHPPAPRSPAQACQGQAASAPRRGITKARGHPRRAWRRCWAALSLGAPLMPRPSRLAGGPGTGPVPPRASQPLRGGAGLQGGQGTLLNTGQEPVDPMAQMLPATLLFTDTARGVIQGAPAGEGRFQGPTRKTVTSEGHVRPVSGGLWLGNQTRGPAWLPHPLASPWAGGCGAWSTLRGEACGQPRCQPPGQSAGRCPGWISVPRPGLPWPQGPREALGHTWASFPGEGLSLRCLLAELRALARPSLRPR